MKLTPEKLFGPVPLGGPVPSQLKLSPSGDYGSFLCAAEDDRERLQLWLVETASGKVRRLAGGAEVAGTGQETTEERAERERRRQFARGITAYAWHPLRDELLLPVDGVAYVMAVGDEEARSLTPPDARQSGIRFSSQGNWISYAREGDLYCLHIASGKEERLTHDGGGTVANGLADFIAQEEMHRFDGHWWSPDETVIAFTRVDEAPIPETCRHEADADGVRVVAQRYPFAGGPNAEVRLGLVEVASGETRWLDWALADDDYLARVQFAPDGTLYVQAQSRDQKRLALRRFKDGDWHDVLTETSETWVNLHDNLTFLEDDRFLWTSEREGYSQLYLYNKRRQGSEMMSIRSGIRVRRILGAAGDLVIYTSSGTVMPEVVRQNVVCAWVRPLSGGTFSKNTKVLSTGGWSDGAVNAKVRKALLLRSGLHSPPSLHVFELGSGRFETASVSLPPHPNPPLDIGRDTTIDLLRGVQGGCYYRLTKPSPFNPSRRYPVIVLVYGGPGVQRVRDEFTPLTLQLFAQAGFGVFELDNRGSGNRERSFETAIHGRLGHVEVADQLAGVEFLRTLDWVDPSRIGIFGHSYGGYMVLMCLAASHAFRAGVSVAPVTDWTLYDTHYTERYLGTPAANPQGYAASSPLARVGDIDAPLLLMHGVADDNVLFTHSLRLINALQDAGKTFELMAYPASKHALQERNVAVHRYRLILDFFRRKLQ